MGEFFAILSASSFAASYVLIKKASNLHSRENGTLLSLVLTFTLSFIIWLIWRVIHPVPIEYLNPEGLIWFAVGGFCTTYLGRTWVYLSIMHIGSVRSSAISKLNPFITVFLSAVIIGEPITVVKFIGMTLIFGGVFISIRQSSTMVEKYKVNQSSEELVLTNQAGKGIVRIFKKIIHSGAYYAVLAAFGYAIGNIFRKKGVLIIADPFYGAMVGALLGIIIFFIFALFKQQYRQTIVSTFTEFNPILFCAGLVMSMGQILYFLSLNFIEVSRASLIATMDTVIIIFLSTWVFKTHENINPMTLVSAALTIAGMMIIVLH